MIDRKKVIKGLECCKADEPMSMCDECPYMISIDREESAVICDREGMMSDAIALLKPLVPKRESRAKVPCICGSRKRETWLGDAGWQFKCMKCGRRSPWGKTEKEAIQNWNKMIEGMRVKQDGN